MTVAYLRVGARVVRGLEVHESVNFGLIAMF